MYSASHAFSLLRFQVLYVLIPGASLTSCSLLFTSIPYDTFIVVYADNHWLLGDKLNTISDAILVFSQIGKVVTMPDAAQFGFCWCYKILQSTPSPTGKDTIATIYQRNQNNDLCFMCFILSKPLPLPPALLQLRHILVPFRYR